ncbi:hypothetical protein A9P82_09295 [Arachidicoccus ginsenosidimutans]|uniref:LamB/YcsF family protein n=1 Tax=Arachidicoccus sp. BS20 TaxID=1850526 RepID=UPI0007F1514E|nr:LamB/YcsF family protein [Arachidicoccus sp. BS20]ANI89470.1 hypothetical protein A9P82_09295 [Arachidicoccus sp. BS20]
MCIDVNCNIGKGFEGNAGFVPYVSSVNICCINHAKNERMICDAVTASIQCNAVPGALIMCETGGKRQICRFEGEYIYQMVYEQLSIVQSYLASYGAAIHHAKLSGHLYRVSAQNSYVALCIAKAIKDFDNQISVYGIAESWLTMQARKLHLNVCNEVYTDIFSCEKSRMAKDKNAFVKQLKDWGKRCNTFCSLQNPDVKIDSIAIDRYY